MCIFLKLKALRLIEGGNVCTVIKNLSGGRTGDTQNAAAGGGLSTAGFSYQAKGFTPADGKGNVIDSFDGFAFSNGKILFQVFNLKKSVG